MNSSQTVTKGYAQKTLDGLVIWDTFTTTPQTGAGWYVVYKIGCGCGDNCGKQMFDRGEYTTIYTEEFEFRADGVSNVKFDYGTYPTKFILYINDIEVFDTGFGGLTSYQPVLDQWLVANGYPPETIDPTPPPSYDATVVDGDILKVEVYNVAFVKSDFYYVVQCVGDVIDCEVSDWSDWSPWIDNGDGTETRTRTRTIIVQPENGGTPCPPLSESQTRDKSNVDCVLSDWSAWSAWSDNGDGTETRTRFRTIVTPPEGGGMPCGPLTETETRIITRDCVLSAWSAWSDYEYSPTGDQKCRTRTRTIVTPPSGSGAPCGPLSETECIPVTTVNRNFHFINDQPAQAYTLTNVFIGYSVVNISTGTLSVSSSGQPTVTGAVDPVSVTIAFDMEVTNYNSGDPSTITIQSQGGTPTVYYSGTYNTHFELTLPIPVSSVDIILNN